MSRASSTLGGLALVSYLAAPAAAQEPDPAPLFGSDEILAVTFTADFSQLKRDRRVSPDRPALVTVSGLDGTSVDIGAQLRTRGEFRLDPANCSFPPVRLDVDRSDARGTVFEGQDKLKVVSSCRPGRISYEQLVITDYLAYG